MHGRRFYKRQRARRDKLKETQWLKKQRLDVDKVALLHKSGTGRYQYGVADFWSEKYEQELDFQNLKQLVNILTTYENDELLENEVSDLKGRGVDAKLMEHQIQGAQNLLHLQRGHTKHTLKTIPHLKIDFRGWKCFLHPSMTQSPKLVPQCGALGLGITGDRREAYVIVADDILKIGTRSSWCLALNGGAAATRDYILHMSAKGAAIAFHPAMATL